MLNQNFGRSNLEPDENLGKDELDENFGKVKPDENFGGVKPGENSCKLKNSKSSKKVEEVGQPLQLNADPGEPAYTQKSSTIDEDLEMLAADDDEDAIDDAMDNQVEGDAGDDHMIGGPGVNINDD